MGSLKEVRTGLPRASFRRLSLSRVLLVAQIAITLLLLVPAGLFIRTLSNLQSVQLGFNSEQLLTFGLNAKQAGIQDGQIVGLYNDLQKTLAALPGVHGVSLSERTIVGNGTSAYPVKLGGGPVESSLVMTVSPGFFSNMGIPLLLGRDVNTGDRAGAPLVAIVNEAFAKARLAGKNPIGEHFVLTFTCPTCEIEIVGVSGNTAYGQMRDSAAPTVYVPFAQGAVRPAAAMTYEIRASGNPLGLVDAVRDIVHNADSRLVLSNIATQSELIDRQINQQITFARLCTAFALLALTISCVGLYATMSYNVARRTSEIGIRMALGARRHQVIRMILREVLLLVALALAISVPAVLFATKLVESFLFGMKRNDPLSISLAVAMLVGAVILAGYLPARSASRIDPMRALRHE
jgi:predicted permease